MSTHTSCTSRLGFTLVEMLVYISIFVLIVTSSVGFLFSLDRLFDSYRAETLLYRTSSQVFELATLSIRQADEFDSFASIQFSTSTGRMAVVNTATSTSIAKVGDTLMLMVNGSSYGNLLPPEVVVDEFLVINYPQAVGDIVRLELELTATVGDTIRNERFYMSNTVRGAN